MKKNAMFTVACKQTYINFQKKTAHFLKKIVFSLY
jgi:hypothetical protein